MFSEAYAVHRISPLTRSVATFASDEAAMHGILAASIFRTSIVRSIRFSVLPACLLLAVGGPVRAQSTQGSILGTVKDASGAVIPGAKITVRNVRLGRTTVLVANARGDFQLLNLEPGQYNVSTSFAGYETYVARDLVLSAHQQLRIDPMLMVGSVSQQVSVDGSGLGDITTDSPVISATLNARDVTNLPANYRGAGSTSPLNIIQVMPGDPGHQLLDPGRVAFAVGRNSRRHLGPERALQRSALQRFSVGRRHLRNSRRRRGQ
jgi:hypothetical protein